MTLTMDTFRAFLKPINHKGIIIAKQNTKSISFQLLIMPPDSQNWDIICQYFLSKSLNFQIYLKNSSDKVKKMAVQTLKMKQNLMNFPNFLIILITHVRLIFYLKICFFSVNSRFHFRFHWFVRLETF